MNERGRDESFVPVFYADCLLIVASSLIAVCNDPNKFVN
jgi:hypothetical protein